MAAEGSPQACGWGWEELTLSDRSSTSLTTDCPQALTPLPAPLQFQGSCSPLSTPCSTSRAFPVKLILSEDNHQESVCTLKSEGIAYREGHVAVSGVAMRDRWRGLWGW